MRALTIEFLRFGGDAHILSKGDRYIITMGNNYRPQQQDMTLDEYDFRIKLEALRYPDEDIDPDENNKISLEKAVRKFFPKKAFKEFRTRHESAEFIQLDLVTSASELWALPFEILYKNSLLNIEETNVVLTRRIRRDTLRNAETQWPKIPRILFAYAHPDWFRGPAVPYQDHSKALKEVLDAWLHPARIEGYEYAINDYSNHLTVLENASLDSIKEAIEGAGNRPYSHVHILAHGMGYGDRYGFQYGIALENKEEASTKPEDLAVCLSEGTVPLIVTLSVCDSGNASNPIRPGNVAQKLHVAGIPIVIASQFPLTMDGSGIFVREFYKSQLRGDDIRATLHHVRKVLFQNSENNHDFVSLVGYVELPEGYGEYLDNFHVRSQLVQLGVLKKWTDYIMEDEKRLNQTNVDLLRKRFELHLEFFEDIFSRLEPEYNQNSAILDEISGLMGSAYKTWAEVEFRFAGQKNPASDKLLERSMEKYLWAFERNFDVHWNGVQYLCLTLVLKGTIKQPIHWEILQMAAERDAQDESDFWAHGSLSELNLIKILALKEDGQLEAEACMLELIRRLKMQTEDRQEFGITSTSRQLKKYVDWWTQENGYFPNCKKDLSHEASTLLNILDQNQ